MNLETHLFLRKVVLNRAVPTELQSEALDLLLNSNLDSIINIQHVCRTLRINPDQYAFLQKLVNEGSPSKIESIRTLRSYNNSGLKDAKDALENPRFFKQPKTV